MAPLFCFYGVDHFWGREAPPLSAIAVPVRSSVNTGLTPFCRKTKDVPNSGTVRQIHCYRLLQLSEELLTSAN